MLKIIDGLAIVLRKKTVLRYLHVHDDAIYSIL